jgi:ubiquinone/menaquinone biosynthesis C-methylase UbiE
MMNQHPSFPKSMPGAEATAKASPQNFFETITAYQRTAALKAAIDLDLFTAIGEGQTSVSALANRVGATERAVRILSDSMVVLGFLVKSGNLYGLSPDSAMFLDKRSPAYVGTATKFMASEHVVEGFRDLAAIARSIPRQSNAGRAEDLKDYTWAEFARSMVPMVHGVATMAAKLIDHDSSIRVLDVAAGHGIFGITVAQQNPNAKITALDWPVVLAVAEENAKRLGVDGRYELLPGDALEVEFGTGFDVVLIPNFMHLWDRATNMRLLKKVHRALAPKGQVIIVEFVPAENRVTPPIAALFALSMLANTTAGDVYTASELRAMLKEAGFTDCQIRELAPTSHTAILAIRP